MAARTGISVTTIQRIWAEASLKPHRVETFKFSTDPELVAKVRDVVGLVSGSTGAGHRAIGR